MHAIAPMMTWVGGNIYAFGIGIGVPELIVYGQPVLKWENTKHGGAVDVSADDFLANPARRFLRHFPSVV